MANERDGNIPDELWKAWAGMFDEELGEEELAEAVETVNASETGHEGVSSAEVRMAVPPVEQEMAAKAVLSSPPSLLLGSQQPQHALRYTTSLTDTVGSRSFQPGLRRTLQAQRSVGGPGQRPTGLGDAKPFFTHIFAREGHHHGHAPAPRAGLEKEERVPDKVNGSVILTQLCEAVTDWSAEDQSLTLYLSFQVYRNKATRFEQLIQDLMVLQAQQFTGYKGTLMYRPDEARQGSKQTVTYVLDIRYVGARNLWRWLQSPQRAAVLSTGQAANLWDTDSSMSCIHEGLVSTIDDVWDADHDGSEAADGVTMQEVTTRKPEIAKWRVILFNTLNVWVSVLILVWPYGTMNRVMIDKGWNWAWRQWWIVVLAVVEVLWLMIPFFQPYAKWFLLRKRPDYPIFDKEPLRTWYEGFGMCRPKPPTTSTPISQNPVVQGFLSKLDRVAAQAKQRLFRKYPSVQSRVEGPQGMARSEGVPKLKKQYTRAETMLGVAQSMAEFSNMAKVAREEEQRDETATGEAEPVEIGRDRTVDYLAHADNEAAAVLKNTVETESGAVISVILGHYVKWDCFPDFEEALNNLGRAAQNFDSEGFVGATLVRPQPGRNLFTVILRFRGHNSLQAWMSSETRRLMSARMHKFTQSEAEVRVGSHTAVDLLLTGHDQAGTAAAAKPPPAKWKVCCIVCVALYICSLPAAFWLTPAMARGGVPTLWAVLVTSTINTYLHGYTLTPLFSLWLKPWLDADRPALLLRYPSLNASFPVRWLYDGFSPTELSAVMALMVGMLIGFGVSADIFDKYGPANGVPAPNAAIVGCGMVFPYP